MKTRLFYLLLPALWIVSCSKQKNDLPAAPSDEVTYLQTIETVSVSHFSADTIYIPLSNLTGSFPKPVHVVHIENTLPEKLHDTLYINLLENSKVAFNKAVLLPDLTTGKEENQLPVFPNYAIDISTYHTKEVFNSGQAHSSSYTHNAQDRIISGYTLDRGYDRIFFTADIELEGRDSKGNRITLSGTLKGSKAGMKYFTIHLY